jgi:two-component system response regulator AtoC
LARLFQSYEWPGNIRELENMIKRIVILQDEQVIIREMTKAGRPVQVYAANGVIAGPGGSTAPDEPDDMEVDDKAPKSEAPLTVAPAGSRLADVARAASIKAERAIIEDTLQQLHWNRRRAAEQLGVSYKTLLNKIKDCGISMK